jgi:pimeloyl-ACP methyl ester carboxylesterase
MTIETGTRHEVHFASGGSTCAAWHYPGTNGACVVMAGGAGVTKEPATDRFAARFHAAGYSVLAFDFRGFGASGGRPRQVLKIAAQQADWRAAIDFAGSLPEVDQRRIALWGFSLAGGQVWPVAAGRPDVAGIIAQTPLVDGLAAAPNALRHETVRVVLTFPLVAVRDRVGGWLGRDPVLLPLTGARGVMAMLTTPDAQDADRALNPDDRYPDWPQTIAARSIMRVLFYRPGRSARRVRCPALVIVADEDQSALAAPAVKAAGRAAGSELVRIPGGHYAPFLEGHETAVAAELDFLERALR